MTTSVYVAYFRLSKVPWDQKVFLRLIHELPVNLQKPILRYKRWQDSQASLIGKLLLKRLLFTNFKIDSVTDIAKSQYGKPYLAYSPSLDFNISHSGEFVIVAVSDYTRIGIDIELIKEVDPDEFNLIFTNEEREILSISDQKNTLFYHYWVRKEAIIKACGKGLSLPIDKISVIKDVVHADGSKWFLYELKISNNYQCFIATDKITNEISIDIQELTIEDFTSFDLL